MTRNADEKPEGYLVDIDWKETSGVYAPANKILGWLVMKNAGQEIFELLKNDIVHFEKLERLYMIMKEEKEWMSKNAPKDVFAAFNKVLDWLEAQYEGYGYPEKKGNKDDKEEDYAYPGPKKKMDEPDADMSWRRKALDRFLSLFSKLADEEEKKEPKEVEKNEEKKIEINVEDVKKSLQEILKDTSRPAEERKKSVGEILAEIENKLNNKN